MENPAMAVSCVSCNWPRLEFCEYEGGGYTRVSAENL